MLKGGAVIFCIIEIAIECLFDEYSIYIIFVAVDIFAFLLQVTILLVIYLFLFSKTFLVGCNFLCIQIVNIS